MYHRFQGNLIKEEAYHSVVAHFYHQLGWTVNPLGDTFLGMSVRMFPERLNQGGETYPELGSTSPWTEATDWIQRSGFSLGFPLLFPDCRWCDQHLMLLLSYPLPSVLSTCELEQTLPSSLKLLEPEANKNCNPITLTLNTNEPLVHTPSSTSTAYPHSSIQKELQHEAERETFLNWCTHSLKEALV